ncbi:aldo/keto reductase [Cohnella lupini]|uniref:Aryl-alcohol dehydrogenase-like predicted oxidoreductase n=1 Tax=Cohnella lupini TaxID=1294267 RepID=A0A3D9I938_9BACL|nr:aldo/keto reductase [Cohnella lupini]RED58155.1 aryl-alcohol dehydrogenase-like predicted oxidoreductase [Cohnella lupini]
MRYHRLGNSGLEVSVLGLGTNAFGKRSDQDASVRIIHYAMDRGVNFIDTANIYAGTESERIIGLALEGRRQEAVLATKAGLVKGTGPNERGSSRGHLVRELEGSLRRLNTDYIDLYQIHTFDPNTPLEETLRALDDMVSSGKVRYIGASNYAAWELMKAIGISEQRGFSRFVATQNSYSLADRTPENELVPLCLDQGVGIIPYFPLAGGILSGKYTSKDIAPEGSRAETDPGFRKYFEEKNLVLGQGVGELASEHGFSTSALSLAWLMDRPAVATVIVGATRTEQVEDNLRSISITLDSELKRKLDDISNPFRHGEPFANFRLS